VGIPHHEWNWNSSTSVAHNIARRVNFKAIAICAIEQLPIYLLCTLQQDRKLLEGSLPLQVCCWQLRKPYLEPTQAPEATATSGESLMSLGSGRVQLGHPSAVKTQHVVGKL